jgi:hypothetical protein
MFVNTVMNLRVPCLWTPWWTYRFHVCEHCDERTGSMFLNTDELTGSMFLNTVMNLRVPCVWTVRWTYGFLEAKRKSWLFDSKFLFYFVVMPATLSVAQIVWHRLAGWWVNDEVDSIWKEAGISWIVCSWKDWIKLQTASMRIAALWANIWSSNIPQVPHTQCLSPTAYRPWKHTYRNTRWSHSRIQ